MTQQWGDRVWETSTTTGTGAYTLNGAKTGYQTFASICSNQDTATYVATDGINWEIGLGTWATGATLTRTFVYASSNAGSAVNWGVGTRDVFLDTPANFFSSQQSHTFNLDSLKLVKWRTALSRVRAGTGHARVLLIGDSTTRGHGATGTGTSGDQTTLSWPGQFCQMLKAAGIPASIDSFMGAGSASFPTSNYDPRITVGSGWSQVGGAGSVVTVGGFFFVATSATASLSFKPNLPVDTFVIWYATGTSPALGTFSYGVDSGSTTNVNTNVTSSFSSVTVKTALGIHAININWVSGANGVAIAGIEAYNSTVPQVRIINAGWSGSTSANWTTDTVDPWGNVLGITNLACDLNIVNLGINDWINGLTSTSYQSNIQTLITAGLNGGGDVVLNTPVPSHVTATPAATQQPFINAMYALGATNGLAILDTYGYFGTYNVNQYFNDYHPNALGYNDHASFIYKNLVPGLGVNPVNAPVLTTTPPVYQNYFVNSTMEIDQVNEGASVALASGTSSFIVDQWQAKYSSVNISVISAQRVADAPPGFQNSLKVTVGTGSVTLGASEFMFISQNIEGPDCIDMALGTANATVVSWSGWIKSNITGTFSWFLTNSAANRAYVGTVAIATANVWTYVSASGITLDTGGTWLTTLGNIGLEFGITLVCGSTFQGTAGVWNNSLIVATSAQTNLGATSANTFQVCGFKLTREYNVSQYIRETFAQNLMRCERFYFKTFPQGTAVGQNKGVAGAVTVKNPIALGDPSEYLQFPVPMAKTPTITTYNPSVTNANWRDITASADVTVSVDPATTKSDKGVLIATSGTVATLGDILAIHVTADARV